MDRAKGESKDVESRSKWRIEGAYAEGGKNNAVDQCAGRIRHRHFN